MTRLEALTELAAKVEAGEEYATMGHTLLCMKAFPKPNDFDGSSEAFAKSDAQMAILAWRNGSLDAARALHEAVLPEWDIQITTYEDDSFEASVAHPLNVKTYDGVSAFMARAWLIAILKALISMEKTDD